MVGQLALDLLCSARHTIAPGPRVTTGHLRIHGGSPRGLTCPSHLVGPQMGGPSLRSQTLINASSWWQTTLPVLFPTFPVPQGVKREFSWVPVNPVVCSFTLKGFKHMLALVLPSTAWTVLLRYLLENSPRGHHYPYPVAPTRERAGLISQLSPFSLVTSPEFHLLGHLCEYLRVEERTELRD